MGSRCTFVNSSLAYSGLFTQFNIALNHKTRKHRCVLITFLAGAFFISGCSSNGREVVTTEQQKVIGAATHNICEEASENDAPACFLIDGTIARMYGVISSDIGNTLDKLIGLQPQIKTIEMVSVPGSMDDEANLQAGRMLFAAGLNTAVASNSLIASGGVDFFLAGNKRTVGTGAMIGVHSWASETDDGSRIQGSDLSRDDPQHAPYIQYYKYINLQDPAGFYFYTIESAPAQSIHYMSAEEIARYGIATN